VEKLAQMTWHGSLRLLAIGALLGSLGCGYQLTGQSSLLTKDLRTIYVEPFINRSRDVGIDKELTTALRGEFYRHGQLKIVDEADQADAIVTGVIRSLDTHVASVNKYNETLQSEAVMLMDVTLRRREPDEILWRGTNIQLTQLFADSRSAVVTTSSEFNTGTLNTSDVRQLTDIQLTESQIQATRRQLMNRFARELHQRMVEMY
jgi:outer membrane lipopolysaccharide assembly protein LptE/RlpB